MNSKFLKGLSKFIEINSIIGGVITVLLMFFIACDVIMRFFGSPIPGSSEIVEAVVVVIIFLGFAWCAVQNAHIKIDIFKFLPKLDHISNVIMIAIFFLLTYATVQQAFVAKNLRIVTTIWSIPRWIFLLVIAYGFFMTGLAVILLEIKLVSQERTQKIQEKRQLNNESES